MYDILNVYLENGLQVIMHRVPFSKTMACGLWIKQGSKHESEPELGLFHLIEHLMINTENFNNPKIQQLMKEVSSEGVSYNAGTTKEATAYYFSGLIDNTDKCLEVLSVIATYRNSFPIEVFEKEKRVVVQEAISFYSSFSHIKERMTQALWGNNGIGNIIVGSLESVKAAKLEDVDDIIEKSYTPENSLLVIVGGIDYNSTLDMVSRHFSAWKDSETRAYKDQVDSEASVYFNQTESSSNSVLSIGFRVGEYDNHRRTELELLMKIIGDSSMESKLIQEVRLKKGLAYQVGGYLSLYENCGTLGFSAVSNNSDVLNVTTTIMTLLNELKTTGLIEEDLIRVKKVIETQKLIELDNMGAHLKFLGKCALNGQLFSLEQDIRKLKKTKLDDVNQTMIEIFRNDNLGLAAIGNFQLDEIIPVLRVG